MPQDFGRLCHGGGKSKHREAVGAVNFWFTFKYTVDFGKMREGQFDN